MSRTPSAWIKSSTSRAKKSCNEFCPSRKFPECGERDSTMQVLRSISELEQLSGPLFLAIGVFDGVHLGHQAVISTSAEHARAANGTPVVVTFDPHPEKIL